MDCEYLNGEECDHNDNEGAECPCGCPLPRIEDDPEAMKAIEILRSKGITPEQVMAWYGKRLILLP